MFGTLEIVKKYKLDNVFSFHLFLQLLEPHPTVVATKLLARRKFIDNGKQFNLIACSWIQFMIHDWIDHMEDTQQVCPPSLSPLCIHISLCISRPFHQLSNRTELNFLIAFLTGFQEEIRAPSDIASACPLTSFKFFKSKSIPTSSTKMENGFLNTRTPWW